METIPGSVDHEQLYDLMRRQIEHEDNLNCQRLAWLVASQAFLFTAFAIVLNGMAAGVEGPRHQSFVFQIIPVIAVTSCALIYFGLIAGVLAMRELRKSFEIHLKDHLPRAWPPLQGSRLTLVLGHIAPVLLPLIFIAIWLCISRHGAQL